MVSKAVNKSDHQYINSLLLRQSIMKCSGFLTPPILDVGCGSRPYDGYFVGLKKINADLDPERGVVDVRCLAYPLPFADSAFSSILCTEVLEHLPEPWTGIREFSRVLKPKGRILISTPCWWPPHELPFDFYRFTEHGLRYLFESRGFSILQFFPRGGLYALIGQIFILTMPHYFVFSFQRFLWNQFWLRLDSWRKNFGVSLGWTLLAEKL